MNIKINTLFLGLASLFAVACQEQTPEPIGLVEPDVESQHPELYEQYTASLRFYKGKEHRYVYAWYDNSVKIPTGQAYHVTALPDSLDAVVLSTPSPITDLELEEQAKIRQQKGTKTLYTIDYAAIRKSFDTRFELASPEEQAKLSFDTFLADSLPQALALCDRFGYDGLCVAYVGKSTHYLTEQEKAEEKARQDAFLGVVKTWKEAHPTKTLLYLGAPQLVLDKALFNHCQSVLIDARTAQNTSALSFLFAQSQGEGVPSDKLGVFVGTPQPNDPNKLHGYFADGSLQAPAAAQWGRASHDGVFIQSLGLENIFLDYFDASFNYRITRTAIQALNPAKN